MSTAATNARFAAELVGALASAGLSEALVCPGSRNTPLILALDALAEVTVHSVLDERAAGFVALGSSRARGRATAVCCTSGSALAHLMPAVVEASSSGIPLMILSADRPRELHECGAPQTIDQTRLFGQHVRWFMDLGTPADPVRPHWVASVASQAWSRAHGPSRGPVHLNVPFSEPLWEPGIEPSPGTSVATRVIRGDSLVDDSTLGELAQRLRSAERGVIVAGPMDPATLGGFGRHRRLRQRRVGTGRRAGLALGCRSSLPTTVLWPTPRGTGDPRRRVSALARCRANLQPRSRAALGACTDLQGGRDLARRLCPIENHRYRRRWTLDRSDPRHRHAGGSRAHDVVPSARSSRRSAMSNGTLPLRAGCKSWTRAETEAARVIQQGLLRARLGGGGGEGNRAATSFPGGASCSEQHAGTGPRHLLWHPSRSIDGHANRGTNGIDGTVATAAGQALACGGPSVLLCGDLALFHDLGGSPLPRNCLWGWW